jgi:hypothetical protein
MRMALNLMGGDEAAMMRAARRCLMPGSLNLVLGTLKPGLVPGLGRT